MSILLGCMADDFTGATDLANTLVKAGMRDRPAARRAPRRPESAGCRLRDRRAQVAQQSGGGGGRDVAGRARLAASAGRAPVSTSSTARPSIPPTRAISVRSPMRCSTRSDADFTVFNPAFPTNKRTVYKGYLFVGDELLSESGMRHHPLTPMTDPSLVRVLQRQTRHKVGLVQYSTVVKGAGGDARAASTIAQARACAMRCSIPSPTIICMALGEACADLKLVTGGSGMAMGLPANFVRARPDADRPAGAAAHDHRARGRDRRAAARPRRRRQVADDEEGPRRLRARSRWRLRRAVTVAQEALAWAAHPAVGETGPDLLDGHARAGERGAGQRSAASTPAPWSRKPWAQIAQGLVAAGVRRLVVAGGETSGAVVGALGVEGLAIGRGDRSRRAVDS